jgi:hypothetical protein
MGWGSVLAVQDSGHDRDRVGAGLKRTAHYFGAFDTAGYHSTRIGLRNEAQ